MFWSIGLGTLEAASVSAAASPSDSCQSSAATLSVACRSDFAPGMGMVSWARHQLMATWTSQPRHTARAFSSPRLCQQYLCVSAQRLLCLCTPSLAQEPCGSALELREALGVAAPQCSVQTWTHLLQATVARSRAPHLRHGPAPLLRNLLQELQERLRAWQDLPKQEASRTCTASAHLRRPVRLSVRRAGCLRRQLRATG